jgi:hypothetical protein
VMLGGGSPPAGRPPLLIELQPFNVEMMPDGRPISSLVKASFTSGEVMMADRTRTTRSLLEMRDTASRISSSRHSR